MPDFNAFQWILAILAAAGMGIAKGGLAGVGLFHVVAKAPEGYRASWMRFVTVTQTVALPRRR